MTQDPHPTERDQRLQAIIAEYLQAIDGGRPGDRNELLARHPDLAADLSAFFASQDQVDRLAEPLRPPLGTRLRYFGDYELLELIARGGMGVVYRARQVSLNRIVALKMILAGHLASPTDVQRFHAEAEAAANLDHPQVVPIYEVGEFEHQHYFSMKLMEGGSLAQRLADFSLPPVKDKSKSEIQQRQREIAELVATVARAVHYAHGRNILHRDLKPANILLDAKGRPHVTDFGLAKRFTDDYGWTRTGDLVGTPTYMAPEQASGRREPLTAAVDVYGLGVVLYELLTGRPPLRGETPAETLRQLQDREPEWPRKLLPPIDRDLETICLKCLQKQPPRRYASAEALADDLERWSTGVPITARRVHRVERLWRWTRRHRAVAGLTAAVVLLLIAGLAVIVMQWTMARRMRDMALIVEREYADQQRQEAEQQRRRAEANFEHARRALDEVFAQAVDDQLAPKPDLPPARKELLQAARDYYHQFLKERGADPLPRSDLASAYGRLAVIHLQLGAKQEAADALRRAQAIQEQLVAADPKAPQARSDLAQVFLMLGEVHINSGRRAEGEAVLHRALALGEQLVMEAPQSPQFRHELATTLQQLAVFHSLPEPKPEAEAYLRKAIALQEPLVRDHFKQTEYTIGLGKSYLLLGGVLKQQAMTADAAEHFDRAIRLLEISLQKDPQLETAKTLLQRAKRERDGVQKPE